MKLINRKVQVKVKLGLLVQIHVYRKRESKSLWSPALFSNEVPSGKHFIPVSLQFLFTTLLGKGAWKWNGLSLKEQETLLALDSHFPLILNAGVYVLKGRAVTFEAYSLFSEKKTNKQKQRHRFTEELSKLMVLY